MQKTIFLFFVVTFGLGSVITQAQNVDFPPGAVIRMTNCTISNDRFNFSDVVERARASDFDENAPNMIWFRRPVYVSPEYQENWDFQIASYYSSGHFRRLWSASAVGHATNLSTRLTLSPYLHFALFRLL